MTIKSAHIRLSGMQRQQTRLFYLFISPWLIGFFLFTVGPMLFSLYAAFTNWDGVSAPEFVGVANIVKMFTQDERFWGSVRTTFTYAFVSVPLNMVAALLLAQLLNKRMLFTNFFRAIFYLPSIVAGVALYIVWQQLLNPYVGTINNLLYGLGINGPMWLQDKNWALPSLIFMNVFNCGAQMLIFLAGLQGIPTDYYEAARLDGAKSWQIYFKITLPLLSPVIFYNLLTGLITALQIFTQPNVMTGGGPLYSTYTYGLHLYKVAFHYMDFGYASTLAWMLFGVILVLSGIIFKSSSVWVYYTEGVD